MVLIRAGRLRLSYDVRSTRGDLGALQDRSGDANGSLILPYSNRRNPKTNTCPCSNSANTLHKPFNLTVVTSQNHVTKTQGFHQCRSRGGVWQLQMRPRRGAYSHDRPCKHSMRLPRRVSKYISLRASTRYPGLICSVSVIQ